jgi:hypothetical protein
MYGDNWLPFRRIKWNLFRDEDDEVAVGNVADIEASTEDTWVTTFEGARFPGETKTTSHDSLDEGIEWRESRLRGKDEFEKRITAGGGTVDRPTSIPEIDYEEGEHHRFNRYSDGMFSYSAGLERHTFTTAGLVTRKP